MMARREKRKRAHITRDDREAAALACLLPDDLFKELRGDRLAGIPPAPAKKVISLFTYDHGELHAMGGSDTWDNLTPRLRGPELKAKDNRDTSIVAKSDRLVKARLESEARLRDKLLGPKPLFVGPDAVFNQPQINGVPVYDARPKPKRSRWPQGRKLQGGSSFQRRR